MAGSNSFKETVESLFHGMDSVITSKTVVGEAIHINGTIILPLMDVSFGIGAGSFNADKKEKGMGGIGAPLFPGWKARPAPAGDRGDAAYADAAGVVPTLR